MPIAASQREQVVLSLVVLFQGMTDEAVYNYPVRDPRQVTSDPAVNVLTAPATGLPLIVVEPQATGEKTYYPAMQLKEMMPVNVISRKDRSSTDPTEAMKIWERLTADIERCLAQDVTLADTVFSVKMVGSPQPFVGVGSPIVAVVNSLEVRLHRTYGEP